MECLRLADSFPTVVLRNDADRVDWLQPHFYLFFLRKITQNLFFFHFFSFHFFRQYTFSVDFIYFPLDTAWLDC